MRRTPDEVRNQLDHARTVIERVGFGEGSVLDQLGSMTDQELAELDPDRLDRVVQGFVAGAAQLRMARALFGSAEAVFPPVSEWGRRGLPFNRKERYFTGTVLPMIICGTEMEYLDRFCQLCGLTVTLEDPDAGSSIQFYTEYGFVESLVGPAAERFGTKITGRDTPDVVVFFGGDDPALLAVEAKMFHDPTRNELNHQLAVQRELLDHVASVTGVQPARLKHVALLPSQLANAVGPLDVPIVTWESVLRSYADVGSPYWLNVLRHALREYGRLVSRSNSNEEARFRGVDLVERYAAGALEGWWMGRQGGLAGAQADVDRNRWGMWAYQCRSTPLVGNRNWFPISDFVAMIEARPPLEPVVPLGTQVIARIEGWDSPDADEAGPDLDGLPEWVEGQLEGWPVDLPEERIRYYKHIVAGFDVDPKTIEAT